MTAPPTVSVAVTGGRWVLRVLFIAVAYFTTASLVQFLAIPPVYPSAIWPPAGIALVCLLVWGWRVFPGVWIGHCATNVWITWSSAGIISSQSVSVAAAIGIGGTLHALGGSGLVRRFVGFPNALIEVRDIVVFLALAGPVTAIVSATWGTTTLLTAGILSGPEYIFTWWTWWIGDTIGVLIFAPIMLIGMGQPRAIWRPRWRSIGIPVVVGLGITVYVFVEASYHQHVDLTHRFEKRIQTLSQSFDQNLRGHLDVMRYIGSLYDSSDTVTRDEFETFTAQHLQKHPAIHALEWVPYVRATDRAVHVETVRSDGFTEYDIKERTPHGEMIRAGERDAYFPVSIIAPRAGNERAHGFDLASDPARRLALEAARDSGDSVATGRIVLVQEAGRQFGVLVFHPIYAKGIAHDTVAARRANLEGFALGVFRLRDLVAAAMDEAGEPHIHVHLFDASAPAGDRLLVIIDDGRAEAIDPNADDIVGSRSKLARSQDLEIAGRTWRLEFIPTPAYLLQHRSYDAWTVMAGGLLLTALLGAFGLVISGRVTLIESVVEMRTQELATANQELDAQAIELRSRNDELQQFVYSASHDLKSPLVTIQGYAGFLQQDIDTDRLDRLPQFTARITEATKRMRDTIDDLIEFSRVGRVRQIIAVLDPEDLARETQHRMEGQLEEAGAILTIDPDIPPVLADRDRLLQIFENIVSNALKYACTPEAPLHITIGGQSAGEETCLHFTDNGPGIAPEYHQKIFGLFQRLEADVEGTGVGLALVKRIAEMHGGRAWVESEVGHGATFYVSLPAPPASSDALSAPRAA